MARAQTKVVRKPPKAVQVRVASVVDGFLKVMPLEKRPVREKVVRKLRQLHPMD